MGRVSPANKRGFSAQMCFRFRGEIQKGAENNTSETFHMSTRIVTHHGANDSWGWEHRILSAVGWGTMLQVGKW
jgi:hypothetical protein